MLIIDCNNICYREAFARVGLSYNGMATGMIYGFLQQISNLTNSFNKASLCLCWDSDHSTGLRRQFHPEYKANRKEKDPDHLTQLNLLRWNILPRIGYHCHHLDGYEADDLIAAIAKRPGKHIIVSSDSDLYQLLNDDICIYDPGKKTTITWQDFSENHGIGPGQWAWAKAIAGDASDNIAGVPGVGIKTAIKFIKGQASAKIAAKIKSYSEVIDMNLKLVTLPWEGCQLGPTPVSKFNVREFKDICLEYGLNSLLR